MNLEAKVAVVTGASSGIGAAVAAALSAAGCRLVLTARRAERLREVQAELPGESALLAADITGPDTGPALLQLARERFGGADILINNAGLLAIRPLEQVDFDMISRLIRVNLESVVALSYLFARQFKQQGSGAIINVSSIGAFMTVPMGGVYGAVKAGVESFTAALRVELAGSGVKVGSIAPGSTDTEILDTARAAGEQPWQQDIRMLAAGDVAAAVRFMLEQPDHANIARLQIYAAEESA